MNRINVWFLVTKVLAIDLVIVPCGLPRHAAGRLAGWCRLPNGPCE